MVQLSTSAEKKLKHSIAVYCHTNGLNSEIADECMSALLSEIEDPDWFVIWDTLGYDQCGYLDGSPELRALYELAAMMLFQEDESAQRLVS